MNEAAPALDRSLDRSQRATADNRCGNHHAAGQFVMQRQPCAPPEDSDLSKQAHHFRQSRQVNVAVLGDNLRFEGYEVITAVDGEEAFEYATKQAPDVIISDYQMPYMTGLELCRALAGNAATAHVPT